MATSAINLSDLKHRCISPEAENIKEYLLHGYPRKLINVLLLGEPGAGKSTLINSLLMAINERGYQEVALSGNYGDEKSRAFTTCMKRVDVTSHLEGHQQNLDANSDNYKSNVCFWDCPGLNDANDDKMVLILSLIMKGCIRDAHDVRKLFKMSPNQIENECDEYTGMTDERKMNLVIFVFPWKTDPPKNLLEAAAKARDTLSEQDVTFCLVVTKQDVIKNDTDRKRSDVRIREVAKILGLLSCKERIFQTELYHQELIKDRNVDIDKQMCDIWKCIQNPDIVGRDLQQSKEAAFKYNETRESYFKTEKNLRETVKKLHETQDAAATEKTKLEEKIKLLEKSLEEEKKKCVVM